MGCHAAMAHGAVTHMRHVMPLIVVIIDATCCAFPDPTLVLRYTGINYFMGLEHRGAHFFDLEARGTFPLVSRGVDGGVTATGVLSRQRGNLITIVNTR